jgi:hypothetical protein
MPSGRLYNNTEHQRYRSRLAIGEEELMLIDEQFRKCTTFLFIDKLDEDTGVSTRVPAATAFFLGVPLGDQASVIYAVTARHVIDASRPYGPLFVRINTTVGTYKDFRTFQDDWVSDPSTDVAVHRVALPIESYDIRAIPLAMVATDEFLVERKVGPGDDVFFVGLFSEHPGQTRNQPIMRFGNISLMPHEETLLRLDPGSDARTPVDAFLVEARSWGGHSGSPAFIYFPANRVAGQLLLNPPPPALLGLVHGHYEIKQEVALIGDILGSGNVPVNAGIAVVIPAQKIIDTLMQQELVEERDRLLKELQKQAPPPKSDGVSVNE